MSGGSIDDDAVSVLLATMNNIKLGGNPDFKFGYALPISGAKSMEDLAIHCVAQPFGGATQCTRL